MFLYNELGLKDADNNYGQKNNLKKKKTVQKVTIDNEVCINAIVLRLSTPYKYNTERNGLICWQQRINI